MLIIGIKGYQYEGAVYDVRASFGISGLEADEEVDLDTLYRTADRALYRSKSTRGNTNSVALPPRPN